MELSVTLPELLELSGWKETDVNDIIQKNVKTGISSITSPQYAVLYKTLEAMEVPLYATLEDILRSAIPAINIPSKWSNVTRTVTRNINNHKKMTDPVVGVRDPTIKFRNKDYIGKECESLGITSSELFSPNHSSTILTIEAFHEICVYKNKHGNCWHDVFTWIKKFLPEGVKLNPDKIKYLNKKVNVMYQKYMKNKNTEELIAFKGQKFFKFINHYKTFSHRKFSDEMKTNMKLSKACIKLERKQKEMLEENILIKNENYVLRDELYDRSKEISQNETEIRKQLAEIKDLKQQKIENKTLTEENKEMNRIIISLKKENTLKRIRRKETNLNRKMKSVKTQDKLSKEQNKLMKAKINEIEEEQAEIKLQHKKTIHKYSNRLSYATQTKQELKLKMNEQSVLLNDKEKEIKHLRKEIDSINANLHTNEIESKNLETMDSKSRRYSDDLRTCVMELHGMDISTNKISNVIKTVSDNIFHSKINNMPCRSTISNICDEGHVIAKHQVSESLANTNQFDIFSDGTARDGKKVVDLGVHTRESTLTLGFKTVAKEDSKTMANVIKDALQEVADYENIKINKLLLSLSAMMSDRSSVMKKTNEILDNWRTSQLKQDLDDTQIQKLHFFYCSAHVLLGFHNQILKYFQSHCKQSNPVGRDSLPQFARFKNNSEPPAFRLIRTASEILGPRGDEKNGVRQQWLAYLSTKSKSSKIINYRGNRFNNIFTGAVSVIHHSQDISDFLTNYINSPNLKLQSVLADISSQDVLSQVTAIALMSITVAEPFWNLINSDEHYVDLYKFIIPLHDKLKLWKENCNELLEQELSPVFIKFPHVLNLEVISRAKLLPNIEQNLKMVSGALFDIVERQLKDHLPGGIYGSMPDNSIKERTSHSKLTNIPAENLFGDLDFSMRRKPNASLQHHSSVTMFKRNHTASWLKNKSVENKRIIMIQARKKAKLLKIKERTYEKQVLQERKMIIRETKESKLKAERKKKAALNKIEQAVKKMGGIIRSRRDIDSLLSSEKTIKLKKEKLRIQLQYCQHFLNLPISRSDLALKNTVNHFRNSLISYLKLDEPKNIEQGVWVAVSFEDAWYPGEVLKVNENYSVTVKFMIRQKKGGITFIWPKCDDISDVDRKFIIFSHFDILPSPGLRYWLVPDVDEINEIHENFVDKYFE